MARAYSIWLIVEYHWDGMDPVIAFTVKHEMIAWLREQDPEDLACYGAIRMPDGGPDDGKTFTIEELLA